VIEDKLGLGAYLDKDVVLQIKQPYQYNMVRSNRGKPALLLFKQDANGGIAPADPRDPNAMPVGVPFLVGKLKQRASGHFYLAVLDETCGATVEVLVNPEMVGFVSSVTEPSALIL
jgi:hypothetical protein